MCRLLNSKLNCITGIRVFQVIHSEAAPVLTHTFFCHLQKEVEQFSLGRVSLSLQTAKFLFVILISKEAHKNFQIVLK